MAFESLLGDGELVQITGPKKKTNKKKLDPDKRGCEYCTLNTVKGIHKIMGTIRGKDIAIIPQSPGPDENSNDPPRELVGRAGAWLWKELKKHAGIVRSDVDIQNVVRCFPADWTTGSYNKYLKMRNPSPLEIHCCSLHTENALKKIQAKQILVFGQVAAKALLGLRSMPQAKTFWSDELHARVYLLTHPSFFIRGYGAGPRYEEFKAMLHRVAADRQTLGNKEQVLQDQFGFIRSRKYRLVIDSQAAVASMRVIKGYSAQGRRVAVDIEHDKFEDGKRYVFAVGFCPKPGLVYVFVLKHRDQDPEAGAAVQEIAKEILEDQEIKKVLHHGCTDEAALREYAGIRLRAFDYDSLLSEYLRFSDKKMYGLEAIAEQRFAEFSGYKQIVVPELMKVAATKWQERHPGKNLPAIFRRGVEAQQSWLERKKLIHYRHLALDTLRLYNGADCDLTKCIEVSNKKEVPLPLLHLYIDLSRLLLKMESHGPCYDYKQHEKLLFLYPRKTKQLKRKAREMVLKRGLKLVGPEAEQSTALTKFNPASPVQVKWALYEHFGYEYPFEDEPNTREGALLTLALEHKFPQVILDFRSASRVESTLESYERSALAHDDRLTTRWWATGARTGRLSSGGEKKKKDSTIINLQNIKKDPHIRNLLVADPRWRKFFKACQTIVATTPEPEVPDKLLEWLEEHIPDLECYLSLDFGQVEIRVLAQMSGDKNLMRDCTESDIHTKVGTTMTGWDADRIKNDDETRTLTKNVHFGLVYSRGSVDGVYAFVQARSPVDMRGRITREQIEKAVKKYFKRYFKVKEWIDEQVEFGRENKYVETMFGLKQTLNVVEQEEHASDAEFVGDDIGGRGSYWANQAVNGPVQGTAHQLLICGMVNLIRQRKKYKMLGIPPAEVHDNLIFSVKVLELVQAYEKATYLMEQESLNTVASDFEDIKWKVPIVVDAKAGLRLGGTIKIGKQTKVGQFLYDWYKLTLQQDQALDKEIEEVSGL